MNEQGNDGKVVQLTDAIMAGGQKSADELERNRKITLRAFEITKLQLEKDAERMESAAIMGEHPLQRRHELMDQARAMRLTTGWLDSLMMQEPEQVAT